MRTKADFDKNKKKYIIQIFQIFLEEGYEIATMSSIIKKLGISKGVFYHYFESKEACARECANYYAKECVLSIVEQRREYDSMLDAFAECIGLGIKMAKNFKLHQMNTSTNLIFHQMVMVALVKEMSVVYEEIFRKGNETNEFHIPFPKETSEMILTLSQFYMDESFFLWDKEEMNCKSEALLSLCAQILGTSKEQLIEKINQFSKEKIR